MTAFEFNELVRAAKSNTLLRGFTRHDGGGVLHKWKVTADKWSGRAVEAQDFGTNPLTGRPYFSDPIFQHGEKPDPRLWRIDVGTGCVNDEPATIEYFKSGDPRGWEMPQDYVPYAATAPVLGADYPFVDRPMWDDPRPFLLVTAPSLTVAEDLGGFTKVADARRPDYFRTAEAWERDLYQASVWVAVSSWRADPSFDLVRIRETPKRLQRWRVFAGRFPTKADAVRAGSAKELARLYLLRDRAQPERDEMEVRQMTYWNFRARTVEPVFALGAALEIAEFGTLAVLPLGAGGLVLGTALLAAETALIAIEIDNLNALLESAGTTEFWSM